jgi:hypothetical protein
VRHDDAAGVARDPPGFFRGRIHALLEHGLARVIGIGQHRSVDVDDDLVARARRAGVEVVMEGGFGDDPERVGLLLARASVRTLPGA